MRLRHVTATPNLRSDHPSGRSVNLADRWSLVLRRWPLSTFDQSDLGRRLVARAGDGRQGLSRDACHKATTAAAAAADWGHPSLGRFIVAASGQATRTVARAFDITFHYWTFRRTKTNAPKRARVYCKRAFIHRLAWMRASRQWESYFRVTRRWFNEKPNPNVHHFTSTLPTSLYAALQWSMHTARLVVDNKFLILLQYIETK